jgi:hypothetical protein
MEDDCFHARWWGLCHFLVRNEDRAAWLGSCESQTRSPVFIGTVKEKRVLRGRLRAIYHLNDAMTICTLKGPNGRSRIRARTGHFGTDPTSNTNPRFETFVQAFCLKREKPIPKWHSNQVSSSLCIPVSFKSIPRVSIHHSVPRKIVFPQGRSTDNRPHWAFHSLVPYTAPLLIVIRFPFPISHNLTRPSP